jgi:cellulose synthase/poly-beta-1,6-N-acetylglucosamine synthase-like glycosyltransferase
MERDFTAKYVLNDKQKIFLLLMFWCFIGISWNNFSDAVFVFLFCVHILYVFLNIYKVRIFSRGLRILSRKIRVNIDNLSQDWLPTYTILVPLYKEDKVVENLIQSLSQLEYPKDKLQILLICEEDDPKTIKAIHKMQPPGNFTIIVTPNSFPKTKAKACNYALQFATGEIITIYDAEDRPEKDQLLKVVQKFNTSSRDVVCIQARLCYYNSGENWLTSMFNFEYMCLFNFTLPSMAKKRFPIPLGGTSNHIKAFVLKKFQGWDPFNVTEDADLGLRIAANGYKTAVIDSYTYEESPIHCSAWIKQRARWIKGYFQTYLVYMRHPIYVLKNYGFFGFIFFQFMLFISPFLQLVSLFMILFSFSVFIGNPYFSLLEIMVLKYLTWFNLLLGLYSTWFIAYSIHKIYEFKGSKLWFSYPIYFCLHMVAAMVAMYQLITKPHHWNKTTHGLTKVKN